MGDIQETTDPQLSIVLPCYNEVEVIADFIRSVASIVEGTGMTYEIVAVNDGSRDGTAEALDELDREAGYLRVLHFSRNFGHMAALSAGLDHARATDVVITMDSDGQHPPELIPKLLERWRAGADIVQTIRKETDDASFKKRVTSALFYYTLNRLGDTPVLSGAADFRLMNRQSVDALRRLPEKARFVRGLVFWIGFKMELLEFTAPPRLAGTTKYSFGKMLRFALDGITSFSTVLLRAAVFGGFIAVIAAIFYAVYILVVFFFHDSSLVTGWSSLMLTVLFMGGLNLIALGIVGEYIGRIYTEVKNRPLYILRDKRS